VTKRNQASAEHTGAARGILALLLLLVACGASAALAAEQLLGLHLPGCGADGGCAQATRSAWGRLPFVNWPLSYLGLSYFLALGVAFVQDGRRLAGPMRSVALVGAAASLLLLGVLLSYGWFCQYCTAAHLGNLLFVALAPRGRARHPLGASAGAFATATVLLAALSAASGAALERRAEGERTAAVEEITRAAPTTQAASGGSPPPVQDAAAGGAEKGPPRLAHGLTGRHRRGPERAAIRIVIFSDYQCSDCRRIEQEVRALAGTNASISISARHFPMCKDCNRHVPTNPHPNACWGARAAEAAAMIAGSDGFWRFHEWLFDRGGGFTNAELQEGLRTLGFDPPAFERVMKSPETLRIVQEDIELAMSLGVHYTPMIFINGVELRGWHTPRALTRSVQELVARNLAPATAENDRPPLALGKYVEDWAEQPVAKVPPLSGHGACGPPDAPLVVELFGDYMEPGSAEADAWLRAAVRRRGDLRYSFRYFPFCRDCNDGVSSTRHPLGCRAANLAEAAADVGGAEAFEKMHAWLASQPLGQQAEGLRTEEIAAFCLENGIDADGVVERLAAQETFPRVAADTALGKRLAVRALPTIFINGRRVPRWKIGEQPVLEHILDAAAKDAAP